jgi:hypothetical protein
MMGGLLPKCQVFSIVPNIFISSGWGEGHFVETRTRKRQIGKLFLPRCLGIKPADGVDTGEEGGAAALLVNLESGDA